MDGSRPRRSPIKAQHLPWREKLRENCLRRARMERASLLLKLRAGDGKASKLTESENVKIAFRDIVTKELQKIKETSLGVQLVSPSSSGDLLWEYDGTHNSNFDEGQNEQMLLEMERLLYEDLREELSRRELEAYEEHEEYLLRAFSEHMQLIDGQDKIWCPVCKRGELRESNHVIRCTYCKLWLDLRNDKVNLNFLRSRLGDVCTEHLDRGCKATPTFCIQTMFDLTALYIRCHFCGTCEVVV